MSNLARLRALAEQRVEPLRYPICLDPAVRALVDERMEDLKHLQGLLADLSDEEASGSLGKKSPRDDLKRRIREAEDALEAAEGEAKETSVVLVFKRLDPDDKDGLVRRVADAKGGMGELYRATVITSYARTESADGENLEWDFDEAWKLANTGDRQNIYVALVDADLTAQTLPFDRGSSGQPDTSSPHA